MSLLIAWAIIGMVFFFGIAMDHKRWSKHDALMSLPCLIGVVLLWPFGLLNLAIRGFHPSRIKQLASASEGDV